MDVLTEKAGKDEVREVEGEEEREVGESCPERPDTQQESSEGQCSSAVKYSHGLERCSSLAREGEAANVTHNVRVT